LTLEDNEASADAVANRTTDSSVISSCAIATDHLWFPATVDEHLRKCCSRQNVELDWRIARPSLAPRRVCRRPLLIAEALDPRR
jgi:hypothetical protein